MRSGFFFVRKAAPSQLTPSDHTGKGENPERGVAELQTGVGTVLRNKGIWLSNREDVVVGHYTPDATAKNESTAPAESRRGILFGVVKVSADATLTGPRPFRPNRAHASRNSPSTRLGHPDRHVGDRPHRGPGHHHDPRPHSVTRNAAEFLSSHPSLYIGERKNAQADSAESIVTSGCLRGP